VKALLVASAVLLSITLCGCKEKPTTEELLAGYEYTLNQIADYYTESTQEAEAQASRGEISDEELAMQYQQITLDWAGTIAEVDKVKEYRGLWPLIFSSDKPPALPQSPASPDLLQWASYVSQVEEYVIMHYQLVDSAWKKLGYS
jgi:hypothetical protein